MIGENIRRARKAKGLSQEELAAELDVVRQTVSKWENGLSVPDADVLVKLSRLLGVTVEKLLGTAPRDSREGELSALRDELARLETARLRAAQAGKVRGSLLLLSFAAMFVSLTVQNAALSAALAIGCLLAALAVLYRNIALLTDTPPDGPKLGAVKAATVFDIVLILLAGVAVVLREAAGARLREDSEELLAAGVVCAVMLFSGWISPRLPYNRHTGLRLPWTVSDEQTWNVAHRVLGHTAIPLALLYIGAALTIDDLGAVTLAAVALWVGIPGLISLAFWWRKFH